VLIAVNVNGDWLAVLQAFEIGTGIETFSKRPADALPSCHI